MYYVKRLPAHTLLVLVSFKDKLSLNLGEGVLKHQGVIWRSLNFAVHNFKIIKVFLSNWRNVLLVSPLLIQGTLRMREIGISLLTIHSSLHIIRSCHYSLDVQDTLEITNTGNPKTLVQPHITDNKTACVLTRRCMGGSLKEAWPDYVLVLSQGR